MLGVEIEKLPATAQKVLAAGAPPAVRMMAAKGIIPGLKPGEIVTVIALLSENEDPRVAQAANDTLAKLAPPLLSGALGADLDAGVIAKLCPHHADNADFVGRILRMPRVGAQALQLLAEKASESIGELIATNEELMLHNPTVIEKLYLNKHVRMSTADRLLELAVRNGIELGIPAFKEAAQAIKNELIAEPAAEPTPDDVLFATTNQIAQSY